MHGRDILLTPLQDYQASGHLYSRRGQYTALQCGKIRYIIEFQCSAPWVSFATKENHHDVLMDY